MRSQPRAQVLTRGPFTLLLPLKVSAKHALTSGPAPRLCAVTQHLLHGAVTRIAAWGGARLRVPDPGPLGGTKDKFLPTPLKDEGQWPRGPDWILEQGGFFLPLSFFSDCARS